MRRVIYILQILVLSLGTINAQTPEESKYTITDWFASDSIKIRIGVGQNRIMGEFVDYGDFQVIGWSNTGLIAYIFSPTTVLACEVEQSFYIYDLINNMQITRIFACSVDWNGKDNKTIKEIIGKLNEYDIKPADNQKLMRIDTRIESCNTDFNIYLINQDQEILLSSLKNTSELYNILKSDGYLVSPFDPNLNTLLFPIHEGVEDVYVFGLKNEYH